MSALQFLQTIIWIILALFHYSVCKIAPEMFSQEPSQTVIPEHIADATSRSQTLSHWSEAHVRSLAQITVANVINIIDMMLHARFFKHN